MVDAQPVRSVDLPEDLVERVEGRLPYTEFGSPEAYVAYVLEEVFHHVEEESDDSMEAVDESEVQDRLKSLGYLNE